MKASYRTIVSLTSESHFLPLSLKLRRYLHHICKDVCISTKPGEARKQEEAIIEFDIDILPRGKRGGGCIWRVHVRGCMTYACENITLPHTSYAGGNNLTSKEYV